MTISLLVWARIFPEVAKGVFSNPTHFHSMTLEDLIPLGSSLTTLILTEQILQ